MNAQTRLVWSMALWFVVVGCASTLETIRPVTEPDAPASHFVWPDYVTPQDATLLAQAERRVEEIRQGELLVKVVDADGTPVPSATVRWVQESRDVRFGVDGSFDPRVWGRLVRMGVNHTGATLDWQSTEPESGLWTTGPTAAAEGLDILPAMGIDTRGSATIWTAPEFTPTWVRGLDSDQLLVAVETHVRGLVGQLKGQVALWEAIRDTGVEWAGAVGKDPALLASVAKVAAAAIRDVDPMTPIVVSFTDPMASGANTRPLLFSERLRNAGVEFDVVGLEYRYNGYAETWTTPRHTLGEIAANLADMALVGKPLHITGVAVPSRAHPTDPTLAGHWARRWTPQLQAVYLKAFYLMALANPAVEAISWTAALDRDATIVGAGLFESPDVPRPSLFALSDLLAFLHTEGTSATDDSGTLRMRGYAGEYRVEVTDPQTRRSVVTSAHVTERELEALTIQLPSD